MYEIEYIKENGIWKFLTIKWIINYDVAIPESGRVAPEMIGDSVMNFKAPDLDIPQSASDMHFLSGYIFPFHYPHPVTGQRTSEDVRNATLKIGKTK
jgi:hypothetical protein